MALDTQYVVAPPIGVPPLFLDPCVRPVPIIVPPPMLIPPPIAATPSALDYAYLNSHVALVDPQSGPNPGHPQAGAPPL
jgi:hypothetical protein